MRANAIARPHPSRRAYARSRLRNVFRPRAPQDEDEHRVLHSSPYSPYKQPLPFPRRVSAPGVCILASVTPNRGVGGAPRNVRVQRHPLGVPSCVKDARERAFAAARAGCPAPCTFLFFCRFGLFLPRSHHLKPTHTLPRSRGAFLRPGFCTFASLTPNRGVGGAPRNVRVQWHPLGVPSC